MKTLPLLVIGFILSTTALMAKPEGDEGQERQRKVPPIIAALDADADGVISADEIENAAEALATLDKNGDGQLTRREVRSERRKGMKKRMKQRRENRKERREGRRNRGGAEPEAPRE